MGTAIKDAIGLHAVTDHPTATMGACGGERMDRTFETIEDVRLSLHSDFKTLIVDITADFTSASRIPFCRSHVSHRLPLSLTIFSRRLRFLNVLTSGAGLRCRGFGALRDVPARFGFKTVSLDLDGSGAQLLEQVFRIPGITHQLAIFQVSILFADQPLDRRPRTAGPFARHSLKMTRIAYILRAEGFELVSIPDLHVIIVALPTATRLLAPSSLRL
jgi:hypothetical protein